MRMDEGVDSGAILLQEETPIGPEETFGELHDRLAILGAEMLIKTLAMLRSGTLLPRLQDHRLATRAPRIGREEGRDPLGQRLPGDRLAHPGTLSRPLRLHILDGKQLKIFTAGAEPATVAEAPGTVAGETAATLRVAAGKGYVLLKEVQLEGKKRMAVRDFLRGCPVVPGQILG